MNVVPYIDVMLVLLVIFMITTPLLTEGVKVDLPKAQARVMGQNQTLPLIITVNVKGQLSLNQGPLANQPLTSMELTDQIKTRLAQLKTSTVYVRGDKAVPYGDVVQAMAVIAKSGAVQVGIMTDPNNIT